MALNLSNVIVMTFGAVGQPTANHYFATPAAASSATELRFTMPVACSLREARVICRVAPGGAFVDTYTVRVIGAGSAAAPTVTAAATTGTWSGTVAVAADAELSLQYTVTGGVATRDAMVTLVFLVEE